MANVNKLSVKITGDSSGLKKASKEAQKDIAAVGSSALSLKKIAIGSAIGNMLGGAITGAIRGINNELSNAIQRFDAVNNFASVMKGLGIATEDSETSIQMLRQGLKGLPTDLTAAIAATKRLAATNGNIKASTDMFLALNNAVIAGGSTAEMQASAIEQLNQAYAKGKPEMQDWKILLQAMPAQLKQVAQAMGYASSSELYQAFHAGKASMDEFMMTMIKLNKQGGAGFDSFAKQAQSSAAGVQSALTVAKFAIQDGIATIMNEIGRANLAGFFAGVANAIGTAANFVAAFVRVIKEAIAWLSALFGFGGSGSTNSIVKTTGTAKDNLAGAATGASNVASGLGNANKQAKKLAQQLAGFDEMNVLREPAQASSGGGGSGGGGGTGAGAGIGDYEWDTSGLLKAEDTIGKIAEKIKKIFSEIFKDWDFEKIGKSIQKFAGQVKKFMEPIGKIIGDIWKNYMQPFLTWTGNSLLPATLNAIGGALEFLGGLINSLWNVALKPLIDDFLVPIAQWTGGIIVGVLNTIGDALSFLAGQTDVLDFIAGVAKLAAEAAVAVVGWNTAATFLNGIIGQFRDQGLPLLMEETRLGMAGITAGSHAYTAAAGAAQTATGLFHMEMGTLSGALQNSVIQMGLVGLAIATLQVATEQYKLMVMESTVAEKMRMDNTKLSTQAQGWYNESIRESKDLLDQLHGKQLSAAEAELRWRELVETADKKRREYNDAVAKGTLSTDDLRKMELEMIIAEGKATEAKEALTQAQREVSSTITDYENKQWKSIAASKLQEAATLANEGRIKELAKFLDDLSESTLEYTDVNGNMAKFSKQDTQDMVNFVSQQIAQANRGWREAYDIASSTGRKYMDVGNQLAQEGARSGSNFSGGVASGITRNRGAVGNSSADLARYAIQMFNQTAKIKSPSRVMMESGGFLAEGVALGVEKEEDTAIGAVKHMGRAITAAFNATPRLDIGNDLSTQFDGLTAKAQATMAIDNNKNDSAIQQLATAITQLSDQRPEVTVKIGEETLIDKVVDGINDASLMRNRSVINL